MQSSFSFTSKNSTAVSPNITKGLSIARHTITCKSEHIPELWLQDTANCKCD